MLLVCPETMPKNSIAPINRNSESRILSMSLVDLIQRINIQRITLGIKDELVAEYIQVTLATYKKYKKDNFRCVSIEQTLQILELFAQHETEMISRENPRIQNHARNKISSNIEEDEDVQDDGNNGDYEITG